MSTYTPYLDLLKKNPLTEGSDTFNITTMLNDNWDKIDSGLATRAIRPNLLDNWYFVGGGSQQGGGKFPINQRGETSYSGSVYMNNRWVGLGTQTRLDLTSGGVKLYRASTSDSGRFTQRLDPGILSSLEGQKVTLSILFDILPTTTTNALLMLWNNITIGQVNIEPSSPKLMSVTITVPTSGYSTADASYQRVQFTTNALSANAGVIKAMKLELGSTQTLAHQENGVWVLNEIPNFEAELAKCQRYQTFLFGASNYSRIGIGVADTATVIHVNIPIPTAMRIDAPALTFLAGSISDIFLWDAAANTYANITAWNVTSSRSSGWLELNIVSSDLTAGKTYILRTKTNTVQVLADANL